MEGPIRTASSEQMATAIGTEIGVSDWVRVDQPLIDRFADLTGDRNFIHVDPVRAAATPFRGTVAHGFLTLSLLSRMAYEVCPAIEGARYGVNYGFNRLRFVAPAPAGARVRARFMLAGFEAQPGGRWQSTYQVTVEVEGANKPALIAEWITMFFQ